MDWLDLKMYLDQNQQLMTATEYEEKTESKCITKQIKMSSEANKIK